MISLTIRILLDNKMVPPAGIEPALPKERDFESRASTNSARGAPVAQLKIRCAGWYGRDYSHQPAIGNGVVCARGGICCLPRGIRQLRAFGVDKGTVSMPPNHPD